MTTNQPIVPQPDRYTNSLAAKLAAACDAVGGVEKKGRNEFQRYNYVKAADIAKAIRHELFSRGILVLIDEKEWVQERMIKTNSGGEVPLMRLRAEITFRDEKESLGPLTAFATAFDSGDKAIYKAKTGLLKYALRGLGLIPDEKDDPEFDETVDEATDPRVNRKPSASAKTKKVAEFQARAWDSACHQTGKTASQVAQFLRVRFSAASIMELTQEDFADAIKWAANTEPLAQTLAASVRAAKTNGNGKPPQPVVAAMDHWEGEEVV
jgi:hypothetical protein